MKILLIFVILLYQNKNVTCSTAGDFVTSNVLSFANMVASAFRTVKQNVEDFANLYFRSLQSKIKNRSDDRRCEKKLFRTATTVKETETENPEYIKLRLEPTALMSTDQLIELHGLHAETHSVRTRDGYVITVHRVLALNHTQSNNRSVLLHHGLLGSSADWVMLGPNKSLPYLLSEAGYDVWLTNARGNIYSQKHVNISTRSMEFWNFSWQEMGQQDLPAVIDYVWKSKTNNERISYIGHSMGATALLVLLSTTPAYNEYLRMGILLAPLALMSEIKGPLRILTSANINPLELLTDVIGKGEFLPDRKIPDMIVKKYCKRPKLLCSNSLFFMAGLPKNISRQRDFVARLLYHVPAGGSTKTIIHYAQILKSGKLHAFNDVHKEFPLKQVTLPMVLFSSEDDWLATVPDVKRLYVNIANPIEHVILRKKNITHTEFVWGMQAKDLVFSKVMKILKNNPNNATKTNEV